MILYGDRNDPRVGVKIKHFEIFARNFAKFKIRDNCLIRNCLYIEVRLTLNSLLVEARIKMIYWPFWLKSPYTENRLKSTISIFYLILMSVNHNSFLFFRRLTGSSLWFRQPFRWVRNKLFDHCHFSLQGGKDFTIIKRGKKITPEPFFR